MSGVRVTASELVTGDRILLDDDVTPDGFRRTGIVQHVTSRNGWSTIRYVRAGDDRDLFWTIAQIRQVQIAPAPLSRARRSESSRALLRGAPWFSVVAVLAVLGALLHVPSGGGVALLIVVLWIVGCVAMVTTPGDDR